MFKITVIALAIFGFFAIRALRIWMNLRLKQKAFWTVFFVCQVFGSVGCLYVIFFVPDENKWFAFPLLITSFYWRAFVADRKSILGQCD